MARRWVRRCGTVRGMNERQLETAFRREVMKRGGLTYKMAPTEAGIPDRVVITRHGTVHFVELKRDGGRVSAIQNAWHKRLWEKTGVGVMVIVGKDEMDAWVEEVVS